MMVESEQPATERIAVARISRPRGNRGEVMAELLTESPERFHSLSRLTVQTPGGEETPVILESHWVHAGRLVLKLKGYDSISAAESLRGAYVLIDRSERVALDDHTFFVDELVGCVVETISQNFLGAVRAVQPTGGTDLLQVRSESGKEYLIPFTDSICREVSVERKRIVVDPPEGLLDL